MWNQQEEERDETAEASTHEILQSSETDTRLGDLGGLQIDVSSRPIPTKRRWQLGFAPENSAGDQRITSHGDSQ